MSRKQIVHSVIPSVEWAREAPTGAIALIVAESTTEDRKNRRVALAWLFGNRNDSVEQLRTAATRFEDTTALATAGKEAEHQDSDGACCLRTSARCHSQWTVRSIPLELLTYWTGFEDAIHAQTEPVPAETKEAVKSAPAAPTPKAQSSTIRPVVVPKATYATGTSDPTLPTFAPLSALILDRKKAFSGNCAEPGKFLTDGRILLVTSACDAKFTSKVKPITVGPYSPTNPLTTVKAQKLFDSAVEDARHVTTIRGYVLGRSVGGQYDAEAPFLCLTGPGDRITVVDGHRALLVKTATGANIVKVLVDPRSPRVVFFKDDQPVAVLLAADDEKIRSLFQRMLDADNSSPHVARIAA